MKKIFRRPGRPRSLHEMQTWTDSGLVPMLWLERWGNFTNRLTPARLSAILQAADDGDITEQHVLFSDMEDRCEHLAAEIGKRKRALLTLDWEILPARQNDRRAEEIALKVKEQFDMLPTTSDLLLDMADAIGHGFSALEVEWGMRGDMHIPVAFHHRPQSWFQVSRENRNLLRLRDGTYDGQELWPLGWVIHTHRSKSGWLPRVGLFRTIAWAYLVRSYALESAVLYTQVHGLPFRVGKYPPFAAEEDKKALKAALANLGRDASGIIPEGMEILFQTPANATQDIPGQLVTRCEQGMSKAILGGTLTTQADGKTSTNALGLIHDEVRRDLLISDAAQIAATITSRILAPLALLNCGVADPALLPWFRFDTRESEDLETFSRALPALARVMRIPAAWAHEKLRIPMPEKDEPVLGVGGKDGNLAGETFFGKKVFPAPLSKKLSARAALRREIPESDGKVQKILDEAFPAETLGEIGAGFVRDLLDRLDADDMEGMLASLASLFPRLDMDALSDLAEKLTLAALALGENEAGHGV